MSTTDPTTGFLIHTTGDTIVTLADYINASINPINDWAKARNIKTFKPADSTALGGLSALYTLTAGDKAYQIDTAQAYTWNGTIWKRDTGLVRVVPTAVSGTGVTVATDGVITFSANTAASPAYITNAFPLDKKYKIIIDNSASSIAHQPIFQFGAANAAISSANYDSQRLNDSVTTVSATQSLAASSWAMAGAANVANFIEIEMSRINNASAAIGFINAISTANPMAATNYQLLQGVQHRLLTAYQDVVFTPSGAGTWTGTIEIWMYN